MGLVNICSGNKNPSGRKELRPEGRDLKLGNKRKGGYRFSVGLVTRVSFAGLSKGVPS